MISQFDLVLLGRAMLAGCLGFLIGWERKASGALGRGRAVGLACLVAAALTCLALELYPTTAYYVIAAIITGSGFLGAGIMIHAERGHVLGLTTAAGLWAMVTIRVVVGAGHELLGVVLTLLVYLSLAWDSWPLISRLRQHRAGKPAVQAASQPQVEAPSDGAVRQPEPAPPRSAEPPA